MTKVAGRYGFGAARCWLTDVYYLITYYVYYFLTNSVVYLTTYGFLRFYLLCYQLVINNRFQS